MVGEEEEVSKLRSIDVETTFPILNEEAHQSTDRTNKRSCDTENTTQHSCLRWKLIAKSSWRSKRLEKNVQSQNSYSRYYVMKYQYHS